MTNIHELREESRYRLVFISATVNQLPQKSTASREKAREILKPEAEE
jgi:hypothetical protein